MRKIAQLSILAVILTGCTQLPESISAPEPMKPVATPDLRRSYDLYLLPTGSADSTKVRVGEQTADVKQLFPVPSSNATEFRELPSGFQSPYSAYGFNQESGTSFGTVSYDNVIAFAMTTEKGLPDSDVLSTESMYEAAFGRTPETIPGKAEPSAAKQPLPKARYWFWEDKEGGQRFMICAVISKDKNKSGLFDLTCAVGDDVVMTALRMDDQDAFQDRRFLDSNGLYGRNTFDKEGVKTLRNADARTELRLKEENATAKPAAQPASTAANPVPAPSTDTSNPPAEPPTGQPSATAPAPTQPSSASSTTGTAPQGPAPGGGSSTTDMIH